MARTSKAKKGKAVALQDNLLPEEEQDESSPQGHRAASYLQIAEDILNAVSFIFQFQFYSFINQVMTRIQSRKRREAKRKAIETEHKQRAEEARAKIESFYEDRKAKL